MVLDVRPSRLTSPMLVVTQTSAPALTSERTWAAEPAAVAPLIHEGRPSTPAVGGAGGGAGGEGRGCEFRGAARNGKAGRPPGPEPPLRSAGAVRPIVLPRVRTTA